MARQLIISILGDADKFKRALTDANKATDSFGKKLNKVAVGASLAFGVTLAAGLKKGVAGISEAEEAEAKFADALRRSSVKVNQQADSIRKFSVQMQKKTKFTQEDILAIGTAIAKHQSLTNVVDKGVRSAEQLTAITADLATVTGKDAAAAAEMLGKALAKPEAAARLLRTAGINLTAAQTAQIKEMVKGGRVAEAQALILAEVEAKTKGAAEAMGNTMVGKLERAKNAFGEMQENLAAALIPTIESLLTLTNRVSAWAEENPGKIKAVVIAVGSLAAVILTVNAAMKAWVALQAIAAAATAIWTAAQWGLNVALTANPVGIIVVAIAALVAAVVLIEKKTKFFSQTWAAAWGWIRDSAASAINFVMDKLGPLLSAMGKVSGGIGKVGGFIGNIPGLAHGGTAQAGKPHIVGERGPELFVPGRTGTVVPNKDMMRSGTAMRGGGTQSVRVILDVRGADGELKNMIKKMVRVEGGGSVQAAFGK